MNETKLVPCEREGCTAFVAQTDDLKKLCSNCQDELFDTNE